MGEGGDICVCVCGGGGVHFPRTLHKGQIEFLVSANCSSPEMGQSGNVSGGVALVDFFCPFLLVVYMPFNVGLLLFYVFFLGATQILLVEFLILAAFPSILYIGFFLFISCRFY
jgi:hypothetical protein